MSGMLGAMDFRRPVEALIPDAQGRILGTLARTTEELTLTTLADLSGVSLAHAARIVPRLVDLGVVERREVPPAVLVRLVPDHLAARAVLALADLREAFYEELRENSRNLDPAPVNVTLFGSFARGDDDAASDVDVVLVRPSAISEDDPEWSESIARWEAHVRRISGNAVNRIEVAEDEVAKVMRSRRPLWQSIRREGVTLQGRSLTGIGAPARA
jgi:predicted nucleotidyltransferase